MHSSKLLSWPNRLSGILSWIYSADRQCHPVPWFGKQSSKHRDHFVHTFKQFTPGFLLHLAFFLHGPEIRLPNLMMIDFLKISFSRSTALPKSKSASFGLGNQRRLRSRLKWSPNNKLWWTGVCLVVFLSSKNFGELIRHQKPVDSGFQMACHFGVRNPR